MGAVAHAALGGLHLVEDFVSEAEEEALLAGATPSSPAGAAQLQRPALGQRWGAKTDLRLRSVQRGEPLPAALLALCARMRALPSSPLARWGANEANALSYTRAEGRHIAAHCGDRQLSGDVIVNLSLAADATMTYDHDRARAAAGARAAAAPLAAIRRATCASTGDTPSTTRTCPPPARVSITFRRAKLPP